MAKAKEKQPQPNDPGSGRKRDTSACTEHLAPKLTIGGGWFLKVWKSPMYSGWTASLSQITDDPEFGGQSTFLVIRRKTEFQAKAAGIMLAHTMIALEQGDTDPEEEIVRATPKPLALEAERSVHTIERAPDQPPVPIAAAPDPEPEPQPEPEAPKAKRSFFG